MAHRTLFALFLLSALSFSQEEPIENDQVSASLPQQVVDVNPTGDHKISVRLKRILEATKWFSEINIHVDNGVVFLEGIADTKERKEWASGLASKTQDVTAVVNNIKLREQNPWDLGGTWEEIRQLGKSSFQKLPLIGLGLLIVFLSYLISLLSEKGASLVFDQRIRSKLINKVIRKLIAVPIFLIGLYLALRVLGLTNLAFTVVGGTGIIGLILGFAFRDIAENFLASLLISIQRPFTSGDLVEIEGTLGYVQSVNSRSTLLMTFEGNYVQIPNATIYKTTIKNLTANPITRYDFGVGIGYADSIAEAQSVALKVMNDHEAIVKDPEPLVLVDALGASTVNLKIYFWLDITKYSSLKVRSAIIRLTKSAFEETGISMPDEAREVIFPKGIPVNIIKDSPVVETPHKKSKASGDMRNATSHESEGDLRSEAAEIKEQAENSTPPEGGQNLV